MTQQFGVVVFVVERPPRYDREKNNPNGAKQILHQSANGLLMSLVTPLQKVHLIKLPGLENLSLKARKGVYQHDGIHLTNRGASFLANHIINGVRDVFKDIPIPLDVPLKNNFQSPPPKVHNGAAGFAPPHGAPGYGTSGYRGGMNNMAQPGNNYGNWNVHGGQREQRNGQPHNYNAQGGYNRGRQDRGMQDMVRDLLMGLSNNGYKNNNNGRNRN